MKIDIPKIVKPISLGEYDDSLAGQVVWMWVNPPRKQRAAFDEIQKGIRDLVKQLIDASEDEKTKIKEEVQKLQEKNVAWWAEMWSQGADEGTRWTEEDVQQLLDVCADKDPQLWDFLTEGSLDLLKAHLTGERKK